MAYHEMTIADCISDINQTIFLPDIQRPYVWDEDDVYKLFDSICRNYPINTVLFWKLKKQTLRDEKDLKRVRFVEERKGKNVIDTAYLKYDTYYLVIDGQQRLTSLYLALKGKYSIRKGVKYLPAELYFNFRSGKKENDEGIKYEFSFLHMNNNRFPHLLADPGNGDGNKAQDKKYWINLKYLMSLNSGVRVGTVIKNSIEKELGYKVTVEELEFIAMLWEKLKKDKLIAVYMEETQDYDAVLEIFIRTNQGGEKLKYSDLLFSHIKRHWNSAREKFSDLVASLNDNGKFRYDNDFVLKAILFINADKFEKMKYRTGNFSPELIRKIQADSEWEKRIVTSIKLMHDLITSKFLITDTRLITSYNALIPIVYFIYKNGFNGLGEGSNKLGKANQQLIREWLIGSMLMGLFGTHSDTMLHKTKVTIDGAKNTKLFPKEELFRKMTDSKTALNTVLTASVIDDAKYNSVSSYLILSLLYRNAINFSPLMNGNKPQQDHIFSRSELLKAGVSAREINSIFNLRYITAHENQSKSSTAFSVWYKKQKEKQLKEHCIPAGVWSVKSYSKFLAKRREMILNALGIKVIRNKK